MFNRNHVSYLIAALILMILPTVSFAEFKDPEFSKKMEAYFKSDDGQKALGNAIENYIKKKQADSRKSAAERAAAEIEEQFKNPVKVSVGSSPVKGPKNAKVTIIEFSDFECPYCSKGNKTMDAILKKYPNDVKLAFKNLPLSFHKNARPAAKAALAAGKQGKFWEMHDLLFANQRSLNADFYKAKAEELGLDMAKFEKDMKSAEIDQQIKDDEAIAKKHGITGTPGFIVNGVMVRGAYPEDHFVKIIDRWLNKG